MKSQVTREHTAAHEAAKQVFMSRCVACKTQQNSVVVHEEWQAKKKKNQTTKYPLADGGDVGRAVRG